MSHINPDKRFVGQVQVVDLATLPWLHVYKLLPDDPNKQPMIDNLWERFPPHYCDRGYADDLHK